MNNTENKATSNIRSWYSIIIRIIVEYLILGAGVLIGTNYFSFGLFLIPLIPFGANYYSAKDRYELYFLNSSLLLFSMVIFMMNLLSTGDVELSAFGMLFSLIGVFEFSIITLILDKIKKSKLKNEKLSPNEEENIKLGMLGVKFLVGVAIAVFVLFFI